MLKKPEKKKLKLESLENRLLMAGNVTVNSNGGNLVITGDASDNVVALTQVGNNFVVTGTGTTINGAATPLTIARPRGDVIVSLGAGSDTFSVTNVFIPNNISVNMGNAGVGGVDTVNFMAVSVPGTTTINTGDGDDVVMLNYMGTKGLNINTGSGNDMVTLTAPNPSTMNIAAYDTNINLGAGSDTLTMQDFTDLHNFFLNTGSGTGAADSDTVTSTFSTFVGFQTGGTTSMTGSDGADTFSFSNTFFYKTTNIDMRGGNDTLNINTVYADNIFAQLGSGNDTFNVGTTVSYFKAGTIDGGSGFDTAEGTTLQGRARLINFEAFTAAPVVTAMFNSLARHA